METNYNEDEMVTIDIIGLIKTLWKHALLIVVPAAVVAAAIFCVRTLQVKMVVPTYSSTASILVQVQTDMSSLSNDDIELSESLAQDYIVLIKANDVMDATISKLGLVNADGMPLTASELSAKVRATLSSKTRVVSIRATDQSPQMAQVIANTVLDEATEYIKKVSNTEAFSVVSRASLPMEPNSVSAGTRMRDTVLGGGAVAVVMFMAVVVSFFIDTRLKTAKDVEKYLDVRILGTIPAGNCKGKRLWRNKK